MHSSAFCSLSTAPIPPYSHNIITCILYLQSHQLIQFGILPEPLVHSHVSDEVLRALAGVHEMLGVVIVWIGTLSALGGWEVKE